MGGVFALEADPGRRNASHPTFDSLAEAVRAASAPALHRPGLPPVVILRRLSPGSWEFVREVAA